jgi:glycosyltransferase involved in cell wall biosynthesis
MKITAVIPVFNGENFIADAINSVLTQSSMVDEIIVVNDLSTDNTLEVLSQFGDKVRVITNKDNRGASFSRNQGIKAASYDFIAFLDADDIWYPNKISRQIAIMKAKINCKFSYGQSTLVSFEEYSADLLSKIDNSISKISEKSLIDVFEKPYFSTSTIIASKQLCINAGLFREDLKTAEDIDLCLKLATLTQVVKMDIPLSITRRIEGSLGASSTSYHDNLTVIESFVRTNPEFAKNNSGLVKKAKRKIYDDWLKDLIVSRQINKAINLCVKSFHIKPSKLTFKLLFKALILKLKYH